MNKKNKKIISAIMSFIMLASCLFMSVSAQTYEDNPEVDILYEYNPLERGSSKPSAVWNLSNKPYTMSGVFSHVVYTNYRFAADGYGEIKYSIDVDYVDYEWSDPVVPCMSVLIELWQVRSIFSGGDTVVYSKTFSASTFPGSPKRYEEWVYCSDTITGLDSSGTTYYYMTITKTRDGMDANISGTVRHP